MLKENSNTISKKVTIWSLSIVLIASLAINLFLIRENNAKIVDQQKLLNKNEQIAQNLKTAKSEIKRFKGISVKLDEVVKDATKKLEEKEQRIRVLLGEKKLKESENLRLINEIDSIKEKYLDVIDSLLIVREKNKSLNNTINLMSDQIDDLSTKLGYATRLDLENLTVKPLRSFANIEMQTGIAKRTLKVKICFDVMANKATDPGMKDFYIRILTPEAEVLTDAEAPLTFMHPELEQKVVYSMAETINYKNQKTNICVEWQGTEQYKPGLYIVEIFTKDNKLGTTTFSLR